MNDDRRSPADRLEARISMLEHRWLDNHDRVVKLEGLVAVAIDRRLEMVRELEVLRARVEVIDDQVKAAKTSWRTVVAIGAALGTLIAAAVEVVMSAWKRG